MKKKLLALGLAVCLIVCMAVPVLATSTSPTLTRDDPSGTTTVNYVQSESYQVTIPSEITLSAYGGAAVDLAVSASGVSLESGKKLQVTVSSGNGWKIKDSSTYSYGYKLTTSTDTNTALTNAAVVLTVNAGNLTGTATLKASLTEAVTVATSYTDTLTFTVTVADAS